MNTVKYLYLNSRDEFCRLDVTQIVYFEGEGNYTTLVMANGYKVVAGMNLVAMQELLSNSLGETAKRFARVGKRHIVNLGMVFQIAVLRQKLVLSDGATFLYTIPVSKEALKRLKEMFISSVAARSH